MPAPFLFRAASNQSYYFYRQCRLQLYESGSYASPFAFYYVDDDIWPFFYLISSLPMEHVQPTAQSPRAWSTV